MNFAMKNEMKRETKQEEDVKNVGLELYIDADKDEYFKCSMYYMRRYFGLREIILLAILLGLGLALFFVLNNLFVLILFAVSVVIILIALTLFIVTARGGYKLDVIKRGVYRQKLEFTEEAILVTNYDKTGTPLFIETHPYEKIEAVSIKEKRIYIYAQTSVFYYIWAKHYEKETCEKLTEILTKYIRPEAFKMKRRYRKYPKKKKVTLDEDQQ